MIALPPVCILAGGRATRLGGVAATVPKALVPVAGRPFVFHQLDDLNAQGVARVVLCVGHLGDQIEATVGGRYRDMEIGYSSDGPEPLGTLGAVRRAAPGLGERFWVLYGDTYLRVDYRRFWSGWSASGLPAGMAVLRNDDRWDRSNAFFRDGRVIGYDKRRPDPAMQWIDYGLGALSPAALQAVGPEQTDLGDLYGELARTGRLYGFEVADRFYEIGSPAALAETDTFLRGHQP